MPPKLQVGAASLGTVVLGFGLTSLSLKLGWPGGGAPRELLEVVRLGFEAGTVGALADWYAVSALFRRLGPHTDIIRRRRSRVQDGIVDMVVNKWLTPEAISEHLKEFSPSAMLGDYLKSESGAAGLTRFARSALGKALGGLDAQWLSGLVESELRRRLRESDLSAPLGSWIRGAASSGEVSALWEWLAAAAAKELASPGAKQSLAATLRGWVATRHGPLLAQLDRPELAAFIATKIQERLATFDLAGSLGRMFAAAARDGKLDWLLERLLDQSAIAAEGSAALRAQAERELEVLIDRVSAEHWLPVKVGIRLFVDPAKIARQLSGRLAEVLRRMRDDKRDRFRGQLVEGVATYAESLGEGGDEALAELKRNVDADALAKTLAGLLKTEFARELESGGGLFDCELLAGTVSDLLADLLRQTTGAPDDPIRARVEAVARDFGAKLESGDPAACGPLKRLLERASDAVELGPVVALELSKLRAELESQLSREDSELSHAVANFVVSLPVMLDSDPVYRERLDAALRDAFSSLVKANHGALEDVLRKSLGKLDDDQLVAQLKDQTWDDLQFIRLNGAVVGSLIGLALGGARYLLGI